MSLGSEESVEGRPIMLPAPRRGQHLRELLLVFLAGGALVVGGYLLLPRVGLIGAAASATPAATASPAPTVRVSPSPIASPLPAPTASPTPTPEPPTLIVLSPHPDDETLSMGAYIADAVAAGGRVEVVDLTDGSATRAIVSINDDLVSAGYPPTDVAGIVAARAAELVAAMARLGISGDHVHFAGYTDGQLTVAEAASVIQDYALRFPNAQYLTMNERDALPDHRNLGLALAGFEQLDRRWAVSRLYWPTAGTLPGCVTDLDPDVEAAAAEYAVWAPPTRLAVGWHSVRQQFQALAADPRDLICTVSSP